ncbi:MAG: hemolysin III family protein [Phycisphaeraceae bacterium]|nr:hemolysin III family protein [Phycisphaerales bacterium]MCB9861304.1 hemolysin III family protein [Phycisphaeraceae bacterium]
MSAPPTEPINPIAGFFEPFSALSHLLGAVVFAVLGFLLVRKAHRAGGHTGFLLVYVVCTVFLLAMSGVYHMLTEGSTARDVLGRLDHAAIFTLIAGTHTPVQGMFFRGKARWVPLALMWTAAITGITMFTIFYGRLPLGLGTAVYLFLGWMAGVSGIVLWRRLGTHRLRLLLGGGVAYTIGAIIMGIGWPVLIPGVVGSHELWHVAVLTAMAMHWRFLYTNAETRCRAPSHDCITQQTMETSEVQYAASA